MPGVLWCDVPEDCGSYCTFVPRGEKKKRKIRFYFPTSGKWYNLFLWGISLQLSQILRFLQGEHLQTTLPKPVNSWHPISPPGVSEGWWNLGTPCDADGEGWVLSSDVLLLLLFSFFSHCVFPPCFAKAFPYRHEKLGESWHEHGSHAGGFNGLDFVALVSCPVSPMDVIEKPKYSIGLKRSEF